MPPQRSSQPKDPARSASWRSPNASARPAGPSTTGIHHAIISWHRYGFVPSNASRTGGNKLPETPTRCRPSAPLPASCCNGAASTGSTRRRCCSTTATISCPRTGPPSSERAILPNGAGSKDRSRSSQTASVARRYSDEEKAQAVRLVVQVCAETGQRHGSVKRVADQLGYGVESVRGWVKQYDIDHGDRSGVTTAESAEIVALRQEVKEFRRANAILKSASAFFAAELDRPSK